MSRRTPVSLALVSLSFVLLSCGSDPAPLADPLSRRQVAGGELIGSVEDGVHVWRGIPFAAPPEGPLRWRAPQPAAAWSGPREALRHGAACPQLDQSGEPSGSEDCLTLNIYAPAVAPNAVPSGAGRLPVMFFIHGGGNTMGSAEVYDGSRLARENGVVVVTVQYRLGVFGWFSHASLRESAPTPEDASGNFGTLDLIQALRWARDNISSFGGDPERVTIFGESAGGVNVFSLLLAPKAKGLFQRAISESGFVTSFTMAEAEHASDAVVDKGLPGSATDVILSLLEIDGRADSREEAHEVLAGMTSGEIAEWLRAKPADEIFAPFEGAGGALGAMYFAPFIFRDGHVLLDMDPLEALRTGAHHRVPTILGTNRDEHKLFLAFTSPHVRRLGPIPIGFDDAERYDVVAEYGSRMWKASGADEPANAMIADEAPGVFGYRFDWDEEPSLLGVDLARMIGAGHAIELLFVFGGTDTAIAQRLFIEDAASAELLSQQMRGYWAEFASSGNPGRGQSGALPHWPAWRATNPEFMVFDSARDAGLRLSAKTESEAGVLAAVATDRRLANAEERCEIYAGFVQWSTAMTPEEYATINAGECGAHPIEARTPFD